MVNNPQPSKTTHHPSSDPGEEKRKKWRDFWIGLIGNFVLCGVILLLVLVSYSIRDLTPNPTSVFIDTLMFLVVVDTISIIVFPLIHRPGIALGILGVYGMAFALVLIAGIFYMVTCFIALSQWTS